ncbi:MAG: solute carrier family 23 protein [Halomonas sp.]|uniref:solute carrier family 23 protein n=1 Tax=Halomonas sp. TaxID=1486246 RepID=UPI002ACE45CA|nr:solute carrier family 23 protein [Halomonas sp.]MDZ7853211.1 solute carrier family 23 protein [Halomonas sp.]
MGGGPFKIRLPFIHYRWEAAETVEFSSCPRSRWMIHSLQQYLGVPDDVALAFVVVCGVGFMLPNLLGVPFVPGWITPAIPVVLLFIGQFEAGPEAIRALVGLQLVMTFIFFFLGITRLGTKLVNLIPSSMKAGILLGAGIAAITGEISEGGRLANTPWALSIGFAVTAYTLFSLSFRDLVEKNRWAKIISSYGMVPGTLVAIGVGWVISEYPLPAVEFGLTSPAFTEMWNYLPFTVGFPGLDILWMAIPTAIIAYIIAFGDIIVGQSLLARVDHLRPDEKIEVNVVHIVTGIRNLIHSLFCPDAFPDRSSPASWPPSPSATATVDRPWTPSTAVRGCSGSSASWRCSCCPW